MSNVYIPSYLATKKLPNHEGNDIALLKEKYGWEKYGDITENELKKVYSKDFDKFWTVIKLLTFQGFEFSGRLNRYDFTKDNGKGYHLFLQNESTIDLDFDYKYAFLKLQLQPNGIYSTYDLHLLPLNHILNEYMDVEEVKSFFEGEGFILIDSESLKSNERELSTSLNNTNDNMSTEKNKIFYIDDASYSLSSKVDNLPLSVDTLPPSMVLRALIKKGYKKMKDLPSDLSFLLKIPQIGKKSVEKFLDNIDSAYTKSKVENTGEITIINTISDKGKYLYLGEEIPFKEEWMKVPLKKGDRNQKYFQVLQQYGFKEIGDLPYDLDSFLKEKKVKKVERREVCASIFSFLPVEALLRLLTYTLKYFAENRKPVFLTDRDWDIVTYRVAGNTLEEVGEKFELTRERVRQIVRNALNRMFKHYQKCFDHIAETIEQSVFVSINDLFEDEDAKVMRSIIEVYSLPFNIYNDYLYVGNREEFLAKIDKFLTGIKSSRSDTHLYTREEIEQYVIGFLENNSIGEGKIDDPNRIDTLTNVLINKNFEQTNSKNHYVYKQKFTKARMCQIVFETEFPDGLDVHKNINLFKEKLLKYFPEEFKNDSSRSIIANLTRDENIIVLWRLGYYKHISAVHPDVNEQTLTPIKNWLQLQLTGRTVQINARIAFDQFSDELKRLEIDSEHALFSLLKIYFPNAFNYSRSPNLVKIGHERMEKKKLIEDYVRQQKGYVTNDVLTNYFIETLGWKRSMFEQNVAASEYLIKTSDGLVHIDSLDISKEELQNIYTYTKKKMELLKNSFSIETVFEERRSTLLQINIRDGRVLYHLIERYYPDEFDFYRYPYIHPVGKYSKDQLSVVGQFETFFLESDDYFLREELYEEFVQERGWPQSTYHMAFNKTKDIILEVYPDEFAHIKLIEWTKEKEAELCEVLEEFLMEENKSYFHITRDIINNNNLIDKFPEINPLFDWNDTLLSSILQNTEQFILLGSKKMGILSKNNQYGIMSEHDYITYLLRNKFNGYVKISDLQKHLYRLDLCGKSIPKYYLTSEEKELDYVVLNDEVVLKELVVK